MFQFTIVRAVLRRTTARRAGPNKQRQKTALSTVFVCGFPVERRANAEVGTWGVSAETSGSRKNSLPPCPKMKKEAHKTQNGRGVPACGIEETRMLRGSLVGFESGKTRRDVPNAGIGLSLIFRKNY